MKNLRLTWFEVTAVVIIVVGGWLVFSAERNIAPSGVLPTNTPTPDKTPVVITRNADGSIDTSDWETFVHPEYGYQIRYPRGATVRYTAEKPKMFNIAVPVENDKTHPPGVTSLGIEAEFSYHGNPSHEVTAQEQAAIVHRNLAEEPSTGPAIENLTPLRKVVKQSWTGYSYSFEQDFDTSLHQIQAVYLSDEGILYRITLIPPDEVAQQILDTLEFRNR